MLMVARTIIYGTFSCVCWLGGPGTGPSDTERQRGQHLCDLQQLIALSQSLCLPKFLSGCAY